MARVERHIFADPGIAPLAEFRPGAQRRGIAAELLCRGLVSSDDMLRALTDRRREAGRLAERLRARGLVRERDILEIEARSWGIQQIDLSTGQPDPRLVDAVGPLVCLKSGFVPWRRAGDVTLVAVSHPDEFATMRPMVEAALGPIVIALAPAQQILTAIHAGHGRQLARAAELRVAASESCRGWVRLHHAPRVLVLLMLLAVCTILAPVAVGLFLLAFSLATLFLIVGLKLLALRAALRLPPRPPVCAAQDETLPVFSIIVALYREADIAARLVRRLARLEYPIDRLDVVLAVEADDQVTRDALARAELPAWMRIVVVPKGAVRTKPRALNHALEFCRGTIIGIYDAEDAPDPLQLLKVVGQFRISAPEVACLQGVLDYYNPRTNWLSRCFTIEYSGWFRLILPGIARLGLAVPLGGTTLFVRRDILEEVGGWDAYNVTEDADLGIRLARHGYRTEMIATTTEEEANCRPMAWVKQRSRWIKGFIMTWAVHMRHHAQLWRELGPRAFLAFQVMFIGTSLQFLMAPLLLSFLIVPFGYHHALYEALPAGATRVLTGTFALCELVNMAIGMIGLSRTRHRLSLWWVATMSVYFSLACLAAYKAVFEIATRPFYWDKTQHGIFDFHAEKR
ncbi:MAG TPA: glycosyltransferase [Tabrizicola sp.]|nr:glycosyltransferase [Tabrizicola sp.]